MKDKEILKVILEHAILEEDLSSEFKKIEDAIVKSVEEKSTMKESAVLLTISAIFAIPAIIEAIGSMIKLFTKLMGSTKGEAAAEKVIKFGHKIESWFIKPITVALIKFAKYDKNKANEMAHLIHKSLIFILLLISGLGFGKAVAAAQIKHATAEGILAALKSTELSKYIKTNF
jgi:hypothetical protein